MRRRERICSSGQKGEDKPPPAAGRRKMYETLFCTYFLSSNNFPFSQIDTKAAKGFLEYFMTSLLNFPTVPDAGDKSLP